MQILSVLSVIVAKLSGNSLLVFAVGRVPTTGWTHPRLDRVPSTIPDDRVLEFDFNADPPTGPSGDVVLPITASVEVNPDHPVDAVIVKSRTNSIVVHATEFVSGLGGPITTFMIGEEIPLINWQAAPASPVAPTGTTGPSAAVAPVRGAQSALSVTTFIVGEEGWTSLPFIEEENPTAHAGESWTDPRVDDPAARGSGRGPFGGF
jgi:hypothetical protein